MGDLSQLRRQIGGDVLTDASDTARYLTDWRGIYTGRAQGVARPVDLRDVVKIVNWCREAGAPIVPQGGNTGLSGGATPDASGRALVLSLERLTQIRRLDSRTGTLEVEAGLTLLQVQQLAADNGRLFPLSLAAEGTCQIGGVMATNAGGIHAFRYGSARHLCLGLEVVLASGEVWRGAQGLIKDNTGYALRELFIGSEGTLGVITAASLRLSAKPESAAAVFAGVADLQGACDVFASVQQYLGPELTACEVISSKCLEVLIGRSERARLPLQKPCPHYVLLEISSWGDPARTHERALDWLRRQFDGGRILDAAVSQSERQFAELWALREGISEAQSAGRPVIKHDISLPISQLAAFDAECSGRLLEAFPDISIEPFGHLGDGNLHYNIAPGPNLDHGEFRTCQENINTIVHDLVVQHGGSISAEHGLGVLRRDEAARYKSAAELTLLRRIKESLDPDGIMNPGKVLPERH
ncbi:MAG: FAD-binding oxidoreductase [Gammaproteobacteria bacterium AqS3]|nr:FAD-binding oxidoreductase [Gammaproteobacteria bacterium AqS3]